MADVPTWSEVRGLVARELGEPVDQGRPLTTVRSSRMTWAARTPGTGPIVVKVRCGDRAQEKTQWCAAHFPALGARGYPVPAILWHGPISAEWHVTVQDRLPGQPVWGLRLPPTDYANNDLNLSNILAEGDVITGVVDWDEFGLGSRALDLIALAFDCERGGDPAAASRLLARAAQVAGHDGLRCLVSYRAIASLAHTHREREAYGDALADAECAAIAAILDQLEASDPGDPNGPRASEDDIS